MKLRFLIFLLVVLFYSFPVRADTSLDGIKEVELIVYPKSYFTDVERIIKNLVRIKEGAQTTIAVYINIHRGGILNSQIIQVGNIELQIVRRVYILLDDNESPQKSRHLLKRVSVWSGSQMMYDDIGLGLHSNIIRAVTELSEEAGLKDLR